jgi:hypothetical protein
MGGELDLPGLREESFASGKKIFSSDRNGSQLMPDGGTTQVVVSLGQVSHPI